MIAMCNTLGLMRCCIAPHYKRKSSNENNSKSKSVEGKSTEDKSIHTKISRPCDRKRNSINSNDAKKMEQVVQKAKPVPSEEAQISPAVPTLNQRRISEKISSSTLRNQLEHITSASSDRCEKVVYAQIEVHPHENTKKQPTFVKKLKNLKKATNFTRNEKSMVRDDTSKSNLHSPASGLNIPSAQSTILHKDKAGTCTKETGLDGNGESGKENCEEQSSKALQEVANNRSEGGKSICDLRINGLTMDQSDLVDLYESAEGNSRSVSMMTTQEAVIIAVKFNRRRNGNVAAHVVNKSQTQTGTSNVLIPSIYVTESVNETSYREFQDRTRSK